MLTREQWENLARFAGVEIEWLGGSESFPYMANQRGGNAAFSWRLPWLPTSDWNDFGPLLVLLLNWGDRTHDYPFGIMQLKNEFRWARLNGTEQELMQAGCLLGAAIGATMGDKA